MNSFKSLTYGQIGGGIDSFIGPIHRMAIEIDGKAKIVSGSFSRNYETTKKTAEILGISKERAYKDFKEMAEKEAKRDDKIDFVLITTPNHLHYEIARTFLEKGFNVVCDKPLCFTVEEATKLIKLTQKKDAEFMVTYTYIGYPMVKEARKLVRSGKLGDIRIVMAEYPQEWLSNPVEKEGNKQAKWRTDPEYQGPSCCLGDIGTHIESLIYFITGLKAKRLLAKLETIVKGRFLEDNAYILLEYKNGASGNYWASQVAIGNANGLKIRIFGTKGSISWDQENPDILIYAQKDSPIQQLIKGGSYLSEESRKAANLPIGHPEGFIEALANLYKAYTNRLIAKKFKKTYNYEDVYPNVIDGARGIKFVHDCIKSNEGGNIWVDAAFEY